MKDKGIIIFSHHSLAIQWSDLAHDIDYIHLCKDLSELNDYDPSKYIVIYFKTNTREAVKTALQIRLKKFKVIKFWTGTDVLNLHELHWIKKKISLFLLKRLVNLHLSPASWLSEELTNLGINNKQWTTPTPLYFDAKKCKNENLRLKWNTSQKKQILIYSNEGREWLYNTDLMLDVANNSPEFNFIFVGNNSLNVDAYNNCTNLGKVNPEDMLKLYLKCHTLIRITEHDGFPRMVIEALYFGLNIIFNYPIKNTILCSKSTDEIRNILLEDKGYNYDGRLYSLSEFSVNKWAMEIEAHSNEIH